MSSVPKELPLSSRELERTSSEELLEPESCRCTTNSKNSCSERSTPEERKSNAPPSSQNLSLPPLFPLLLPPTHTGCPRCLFLPFLSIFHLDDHLFRFGNTSSREACIFRVLELSVAYLRDETGERNLSEGGILCERLYSSIPGDPAWVESIGT